MENRPEIQPLDVTRLSEYHLLVGQDMQASPEVLTNDGVPIGDAERQRTECSLNCLELLLRGDQAAYQQLTAPQKEAARLSEEQFRQLHQWFTELMPTERQVNVMRYIMLVHDLGKNPAVATQVTNSAESIDHDEVMRRLLSDRYTAQRQMLLPTFGQFDQEDQEIIRRVLSQDLNLGQFMQAEAPAAALAGLSEDDQSVRALYIAHTVLDIAGAAGHRNITGSMILTSSFYQQVVVAIEALHSHNDSQDCYNHYLAGRAEMLGINVTPEEISGNPIQYAQVRLACMLRMDNPVEFAHLREAYEQQLPPVQAILAHELARTGVTDRATLVYYAPALLAGLRSHDGLAESLTYFAHILQEVQIADSPARRSGQSGVVVADVSELAHLANQGELDISQAELRVVRRGDMYLPQLRQVPSISLENVPEFSTDQLRGKRVLYVGMGGGSDGLQAAMLSQLHMQAADVQPVAIVSVRAHTTPLTNPGRRRGTATLEVTAQTRATGWRFLEHIVAQDDRITTPIYMLNPPDSHMTAVVADDVQTLIDQTGAEVVIGVDTGGDVMYRPATVDRVDASPDQDAMVLAALAQISRHNPALTVLTGVVALGVDAPDYANVIMRAAGAQRSAIIAEHRQAVGMRYQKWRMDGSGSQYGLYGKTPLALLAALRGEYGLRPLPLPAAVAVSDDNPWRIYTTIRPAMSSLVLMPAAELYQATHSPLPAQDTK